MQYEEQQRRFAKVKEIVPLLQEWEDYFSAQADEVIKHAEAIRDAERDPHSNRFATEVRRGKEYLIEFNKKRVAMAEKILDVIENGQ